MTIRPANGNDAETLASVLRWSFATVAKRFGLTLENCPKSPAFCTRQRVDEDIARGMRFYLLEEAGCARGCVALEQAGPNVVYLGRLAVLPEHRSTGLGKALVRHALEEARAGGATRVEIGLIAADAQLKEWYRQFGFEQTGTKTFDHLPFVVAFMAVEP